jgi:LacI family transcriptional regulator
MARVTLQSVAALAEVGTATAERVLNGRGGVRPALVERVLAAARRLDYAKRLPDMHRGVTRIEVLLSRPELSFISRLIRSFERIASSLDPSIAVHRTFVNENDPMSTAQYIASPAMRRSALIVALPDHPAIRTALAGETAKGIPIVQLVSPMKGIAGSYVGIDNCAAGRMAGLLMAGMQKRGGTVVGMCHSQIYAVHRDRMLGFSEAMAKSRASHLQFQHVAFTLDNDMEAATMVSGLLRVFPDLVGIYSAGGDYGPLCDMLRRQRRRDELCIIGHELTEQSSAALRDGTMAAIIDQAPETQARRALDIVLNRLGLLSAAADLSPIRFITVTGDTV